MLRTANRAYRSRRSIWRGGGRRCGRLGRRFGLRRVPLPRRRPLRRGLERVGLLTAIVRSVRASRGRQSRRRLPRPVWHQRARRAALQLRNRGGHLGLRRRRFHGWWGGATLQIVRGRPSLRVVSQCMQCISQCHRAYAPGWVNQARRRRRHCPRGVRLRMRPPSDATDSKPVSTVATTDAQQCHSQGNQTYAAVAACRRVPWP